MRLPLYDCLLPKGEFQQPVTGAIGARVRVQWWIQLRLNFVSSRAWVDFALNCSQGLINIKNMCCADIPNDGKLTQRRFNHQLCPMAGGARKPAEFLCLILKLLQIQPDKEIIIEYIKNEDYKYVRILGERYLVALHCSECNTSTAGST